MTRQKAIAMHLVAGKVVNIKTAYNLFGISNVSREMIRLIEQPFSIHLTRTQRNGKTKYGQPCYWIDYSLTFNRINSAGIKAMIQALADYKTTGGQSVPKTATKSNQLKKKVSKLKGKV